MAVTYIHLKDTAAGAADGSSWAAAMGESEFETYMEGSVAADTVVLAMDGSYSYANAVDWSARAGTATAPILIIGVKAGTTHEGAAVVYSDWSVASDDRPFWDFGSNGMTTSDYNYIANISFEGAAASTVALGVACNAVNCKFYNDYGSSAARQALNAGTGNIIVNCEMTSTNVRCANIGGSTRVYFSYFHDATDATYGIGSLLGGNGIQFGFCIFDNLVKGITTTSARSYAAVANCSFYDTDSGILTVGADPSWIVMNNIFSDCATDAVKWTTQTNINLMLQNHMYNNGDDWDGVAESGPWMDVTATSGDPKFATAGSDFSLQATSPCLDAGASIILGV